jgi:hypothetical protein
MDFSAWRRHRCFWVTVGMALVSAVLARPAVGAERADAGDPLAPWRTGVTVRPVSQAADRHTIHSYFDVCPESPDGRRVVFYASTTAEGYSGELRIQERATGQEQVLAPDITVEDAHRAACQQWVSQGRRVAFHNLRDGQWLVVAVDVDTRRERILARDHQIGWGRPDGDLVPVYGCHWNPGAHPGMELVNAETGQLRTIVTAAAVKAAYPEWIARQFGDRPVSIFFPILSPNQKRAFFKMATPGGGDFRSSKASQREGLVCYDMAAGRFLLLRQKWGHPAWGPDSQHIIEVGHLLIDSDTGATRRLPGLPPLRGSHPSLSPDGKLFVADAVLESAGGAKGQWGIVVGRSDGGDCVTIHRFDHSRGARSWRKAHPHPSFSADGKRIYFNVSSTEWTRLYVAEGPAKR